MFYREFEIETFEVGRGQWHARVRRRDRAPTVVDGIEFEVLHIGFAWSTNEAAESDARNYIDNMGDLRRNESAREESGRRSTGFLSSVVGVR